MFRKALNEEAAHNILSGIMEDLSPAFDQITDALDKALKDLPDDTIELIHDRQEIAASLVMTMGAHIVRTLVAPLAAHVVAYPAKDTIEEMKTGGLPAMLAAVAMQKAYVTEIADLLRSTLVDRTVSCGHDMLAKNGHGNPASFRDAMEVSDQRKISASEKKVRDAAKSALDTIVGGYKA